MRAAKSTILFSQVFEQGFDAAFSIEFDEALFFRRRGHKAGQARVFEGGAGGDPELAIGEFDGVGEADEIIDDDAGAGAAVQAERGFIDDAGFAVGGELDVGGEGAGEELGPVFGADDPAEFEVADGFVLPILDVDAGCFGFVAGDGGEAAREFDGGIGEAEERELDLAIGLVDGGGGVGGAREGASPGDLNIKAGPVLQTGDGSDEFALEGVRATGF